MQKDYSNLLHSFAKIRKVRKVRLVILGTGEQELRLRHLIRELGLENDIDMPGHVKNPFSYMSRAAVFALSSAWEGLANVLIEAMALGTPVVSTNCPSGPAEVLDGGRYGLLVPTGDSNALAEAIIKALDGKGKKAPPAWLEQFSVDSVVPRYLEMIRVEHKKL